MSARVYNPLFMSEMRRMLRGGSVAGGAGGVSAAATAGCGGEAASAGGGGYPPPAPPAAELDRVRRQLFGPVDHEETRRFVQRELQAMRQRDSEHYGFDFERESPLPGSRLVWEKVEPTAAVPAPYALRRLPYLATHAEEAADGTRGAVEEVVQTQSPAPVGASASSAETTPVSAAPALAQATNNNVTPKQTCISDFMKSRKRTSGSTGTKTNKLKQEGPSVKQAKKTHS